MIFRRTIIAILIFLTSSVLTRFAFDPTRSAVLQPYSEFKNMLASASNSSIGKQRIELGMSDFWGRRVMMFKLPERTGYRFVYVPDDMYNKILAHPGSMNIRLIAVCPDPTPLLEILCAVSISILVIALCTLYSARFKVPEME